MRRREFITLVGGAAAAWPFAAVAQQSAMPVVGFLRNTDAASSEQFVSAFRRGLGENGYVEGHNVAVEYRWAENHDDKLPALAADLVKRNVAVIFAGGGSVVALAAKAATASIPIVFELGGDPVKLGLVASLNRPGGNLTGIALFANVVGGKRIELFRDLAPRANVIGLLVNPTIPNIEAEITQVLDAATLLGMHVDVFNAAAKGEIEPTFANLRRSNAGGLIITANPLFVANRDYLIGLAARDGIPVMYPFPSFVKAGGLMSYGDDLVDAFRQAGVYTSRILDGQKPSDLPVVQPTKFALAINLKTAKSLGLNVPPTLLAIADEVIE